MRRSLPRSGQCSSKLRSHTAWVGTGPPHLQFWGDGSSGSSRDAQLRSLTVDAPGQVLPFETVLRSGRSTENKPCQIVSNVSFSARGMDGTVSCTTSARGHCTYQATPTWTMNARVAASHPIVRAKCWPSSGPLANEAPLSRNCRATASVGAHSAEQPVRRPTRPPQVQTTRCLDGPGSGVRATIEPRQLTSGEEGGGHDS
jgi:hypothetical protein